jgi:hypothetical protein
MPEDNNFDSYLPDESPPDKLSIDIPAEQPISVDRIPSGYDPMGEVELRGRVSQGMASGRIPWWVLITGWVLAGGFAFLMVHLVLQAFSWLMVLPLAVAIIFLLILWRGTQAKLANGRR